MTYAVEVSHDHVERAKDKLLRVLRRPRIQALVEAGAAEVQRLEDLTHQVAAELNLDTDYDWILDAIGRIVGRGRGNAPSNDVYRVGLRAQIRINRSFGRAKDLREIQELSKPGNWTTLDRAPASQVTWHDDAVEEPGEHEQIRINLEQQKPLGVRLDWITSATQSRQPRFGTVTDAGIGSAGLSYWSDDSYGALAAHVTNLQDTGT